MKKIVLIIGLIAFCSNSFSQETSVKKDGENLDLYATLELFKDSKSVEDFESQLNSEKSEVNNLDINKDGFVDYIRVIDYTDGDVHTLTLQVPLSEKEAQDVAVIELDKDGETTTAQIVGDEDLYGKDFIIEPTTNDLKKASNVSNWKVVKHIYAPNYVAWISPWRYNRHPKIYRRWSPVTAIIYSGRTKRHHVSYRRVNHHRSNRAQTHYKKHRVHRVVKVHTPANARHKKPVHKPKHKAVHKPKHKQGHKKHH
tara:strand:- start:6773 stop:7537 length:765 start_codon:yes stop_codon:yes gene_type:complete